MEYIPYGNEVVQIIFIIIAISFVIQFKSERLARTSQEGWQAVVPVQSDPSAPPHTTKAITLYHWVKI